MRPVNQYAWKVKMKTAFFYPCKHVLDRGSAQIHRAFFCGVIMYKAILTSTVGPGWFSQRLALIFLKLPLIKVPCQMHKSHNWWNIHSRLGDPVRETENAGSKRRKRVQFTFHKNLPCAHSGNTPKSPTAFALHPRHLGEINLEEQNTIERPSEAWAATCYSMRPLLIDGGEEHGDFLLQEVGQILLAQSMSSTCAFANSSVWNYVLALHVSWGIFGMGIVPWQKRIRLAALAASRVLSAWLLGSLFGLFVDMWCSWFSHQERQRRFRCL